MKTKEAIQITHTLGKPSKMPGFSYGLPAQECKTGSKLAKIKGSVCYGCYALKGCYRFKAFKQASYKRLKGINHPLWSIAMAAQINSKKSKYFRWHDSGDVQDLKHLAKIYRVCRLTPGVKHWMPTREAWTKKYLNKKPANLVIRFSGTMVDQAAPDSWPNTSTVTTSKNFTCPAPKQNNKCMDCRACWDPSVKNVAYAAH